jgi:RNA polymerase sigma factor (sigma-70 family)
VTPEQLIQAAIDDRKKLRSRLRVITRNDADADELLGDVYVRLLTVKSGDAAKVRSAAALVQTVTRNVALDHVRRQKSNPVELIEDVEALYPIDERASLEDNAIAQQEFDELIAILEKFPRRLREVLWLYRAERYSHEEIAAILGISVETSRKHLALAVIRLTQALRGKGCSK